MIRKLALSLCLLAPVSAGAQDLSPNAQILVAARQGDLAAAKRLLEDGAAVNSRNRLGDTPLLIALKNGYKDVARLAVERGANVNLANLSSVTPLMAASFSGNAELVKVLLEKGAERAPVDRVGKTAMVYAAGLAEQLLSFLVCALDRHRERGLAAVVARAGIGAALEQQLHRARVAVGRRPHQRGEIVVIRGAGALAVGEEQFDHLGAPKTGGVNHGRFSDPVHRRAFCAFFKQHFHELRVARETRRHQRRHARKVGEIHVRPSFDGEPRHVAVAILQRDQERRIAQAVARVHRRTALQQPLHRSEVALPRCNKKLGVGGKILCARRSGREQAKRQSQLANQRLSP